MQQPPHGHPPHAGQPPPVGFGTPQPPPGYAPQPAPGYGQPHGHQHSGQQQYGHQHYGQQQYGQQQYGAPPPGYGMAPPLDPRVHHLNEQSTTWLIVSLVGFWLGAGLITGPLSWVKAGRIRAQYHALGLPASGNATAAWAIGMVCTALYGMLVLALVTCTFMVAGAAATNGL